MRRLLYVPIVHTPTDMGSLSASVRQEHIQKLGEASYHKYLDFAKTFWNKIHDNIFGRDLDYKKVRVYQDGLPVCPIVDKIVADVAAQGNPNFTIVKRLGSHGATIEGTEDPKLLLREYECAKNKTEPEPDLLDMRDQFIAERIAATLQEGETGILFVGALHKVPKFLPDDIQIEFEAAEIT